MVRPYDEKMRKVSFGVAVLFFSAALTRAAEERGVSGSGADVNPAAGASVPGASLFRWVTPQRKHRLGMSPEDKARHAENSKTVA